jgi:hypothetical protein
VAAAHKLHYCLHLLITHVNLLFYIATLLQYNIVTFCCAPAQLFYYPIQDCLAFLHQPRHYQVSQQQPTLGQPIWRKHQVANLQAVESCAAYAAAYMYTGLQQYRSSEYWRCSSPRLASPSGNKTPSRNLHALRSACTVMHNTTHAASKSYCIAAVQIFSKIAVAAATLGQPI